MENRAVLVTGASSGIGKESALLLARHGFRVFAGVRKPKDGQALVEEAAGSLTPVLIDVTDPVSIRSAAQSIRGSLSDNESFSLVNNAGMTVAGPLEIVPLDSLRLQFEVNVIGQVAVTQAFLPLLRAHRGRIVIMGSVLGRISPPLVGPYAAAKFALEAITDSLSIELRGSGVRVVLLEPGNIATPIWEKSRDEVLTRLDSLQPVQRAAHAAMRADIVRIAGGFARGGIASSRVARTVLHALTVRTPRTRYRVGIDSKILSTFSPLVPDRFRHWLTRVVLSLVR